jgi:hypothetical protein
MCGCDKAKTEASGCSCNQTPASSCGGDPASSCAKKSAGCGCSTEGQTCINPKSVNPITSSEEASNKYSIETVIKSSSGGQSSLRAGTAIGADAAALVVDAQNALRDVIVETIRGVVGQTYASTAVTANTSITPLTTTLASFKGYFTTAALIGVTGPTASQLAKIDYIAEAVYPVFTAIKRHIEGDPNDTTVCVSGSSRVFRACVENCLFNLTFIYN